MAAPSVTGTTNIANVIVPDIFDPYVVERSTQLSELWNSGIVAEVPELDVFNAKGGTLVSMPFWIDLSGPSQVLAENVPLTVNNITSDKDVAVLQARGNAWGSNDFAGALAVNREDPMTAIGNLVGDWWGREYQRLLLLILKGVFAASNMSSNLLDITGITGANAVNGHTLLDAMQLLGDAKSALTAMCMHSATMTQLAKLDLITFRLDSEGEPTIPFYLGKRVLVDDTMPTTGSGATTKYTTYLFGPGAIGWADGGAPEPTETDRFSLAGQNILINRRHFVLHPRGVRWQGSVTSPGVGPNDTDLQTGTNWTRVWNQKHVRIVQMIHYLTVQ